ncbi:MAG TPA: alpha/beta fold hydrolase [Acidimicrobiales bacterium]|nr:alpha/beta fold hydrolase [Acidimicrobiales bacterium]
MRRRWQALLVLTTVVVAACGGGGDGPAPAPAGFDVRTETFVDASRGDAPRGLETTIYTPRGEVAGRPLVVFAHGSGGNPDFYRVLLEAWAAAGYVVAAPRLPPDRREQPGHVSFVVSELLRVLGGVVDPRRIGVAGHSAGGVTALAVGLNSCCVDRRVRAVAVLAADSPPFPGGAYFSGISTPLLVVHGLADPTVPFAEGRRIFTEALPPKILLTVPASDTPSADHARPFAGSENRPLPDTRVVTATVIGFFDRYLRDDRAALDRIRKAVDDEVSFGLEVVEQ